ncbi:MAG: glycoside hydrolase domain-containing protein [Bacteroidota bacterium]
MPDKKQQSGQETGAWFTFDNTKEVQMKIGLSFVSMENALLNLDTEQPGWDFNGIREKAREEWNNQLSKIAVQSEDEDNKTIFYTALYHALQHPNIINDVNGEYPAMHSHETKNTGGERDQYTVYSLWDTYRTLHPLPTLVYPQQQTHMLATMADMAEETGYLPFWELGAYESYVMNDDAGTISAWYLFSSMGFYPVCPGKTDC